jgi:hypothetical protein
MHQASPLPISISIHIPTIRKDMDIILSLSLLCIVRIRLKITVRAMCCLRRLQGMRIRTPCRHRSRWVILRDNLRHCLDKPRIQQRWKVLE